MCKWIGNLVLFSLKTVVIVMIMKKSLLFLTLSLVCAATYGQTDVRSRGSGATNAGSGQNAPQAGTRIINGKVVDYSGEPVVGAEIKVIDKASGRVITGTYSDANGAYAISFASNPSYTLAISYIGLKTQEVSLAEAQNQVDFTMQEDLIKLDEVMVVAYGTERRGESTGSNTKVTGDQITNIKTTGFDQALQGRVAGLQVIQPSGRLGDAPIFRIQGTNSFSLSSQPLIVIDGVPAFSGDFSNGVTTTNVLNNINPYDIESIEVLKDGASAAVLGSRAANGVIMITTKRGKAGRTQVSYNFSGGLQVAANKYNLLNATDFITITNEKLINAGQPQRAIPFAADPTLSTDWMREVTRNGYQQNHTLSVSGGNEKTKFSVSIGYADQSGFILPDALRRGTARIALDHNANKFINVGATVGYARTFSTGFNGGQNSIGTPFRQGILAWPNVPARAADGSPYITTPAINRLNPGSNTFGPAAGIGQIVRNPLGYTDFNRNNNDLQQLDGNVYADIKIIEGLKIRNQFGVNYIFSFDDIFWNPIHGESSGVLGNGYAFNSYSNTYRWNYQSFASYDRSFGDHTIGVLAGYEFQLTEFTYRDINVSSFTDPFFQRVVTGSFPASGILGISGANTRTAFQSYFGRLNYSYKGKYMAQASLRNDGISQLSDRRYGTFWGASAGWRFTEETFFKNFGIEDILSNGKLRVSYGTLGNFAGLGAYASQPTFAAINYALGGGLVYSTPGNTNLRWETVGKFLVGLEFGLLKDRISVTAEYYNNQTTDLIFSVPQPTSLGIPNNALLDNVGRLRNQGFTFNVEALVYAQGKFSWTAAFNLTTVDNRMTQLYGNINQIINGNYITLVGEQIGTNYNFQYFGVNPANGNPQWFNGAGRLVEYQVGSNGGIWRNVDDGSAASSLGANDRVLQGRTIPTYYGGFDNTFKWNGIDLSIFITYSGGNRIFNQSKNVLLANSITNNGTEIMNRWTTPGQITNIPRVFAQDATFANFMGSYQYEDGSFVRLRNITLGYTLPKSVVSVMDVTSFRVYATATNLYVWSKYTGIDPEANRNGNTNSQQSYDFLNMPQARTFVIGVDVTF
jgi:TonB-linked SusC/RagA family outer membrane protein